MLEEARTTPLRQSEQTETQMPRRRSPKKTPRKPRRPRRFWSEAETRDLSNACLKHGVGAWKKMVEDPEYNFSNRTAVDLKDKFRATFTSDYNRLYGRFSCISDQFVSHASLASDESDDSSTQTFRRVQRRKKHYFTAEDDKKLLEGIAKYGSNWAKICHDTEIGLSHRKSSDLRDRIRNAYPEKYEELGFSLDLCVNPVKTRASRSTLLAPILKEEESDK
ncbi:hypothetical protein G9A89_014786 [Geosiphon pyriformis]|nr:hypothetical protein G9A89_014786 [Geosiphon pyriformis]